MLWPLLALFIATGCGYKPSSQHARALLGSRVSTEVRVSLQDPQNTVLIKDAINKAVITRFRASLATRDEADSHLIISIKALNFSPLQYNQNGYIVAYRTMIVLDIERVSGEERGRYRASSVYDFGIEPNAIISDQARFEAIRQSAQKALDLFVAQAVSQGAQKKE
ncbi:MAG: hypothetical protein JXK05_12635 [Campylobacterales bacterium]|nr:hypothetical protein [Campylobacterales bacterium]